MDAVVRTYTRSFRRLNRADVLPESCLQYAKLGAGQTPPGTFVMFARV